jgi:hypothetical protein
MSVPGQEVPQPESVRSEALVQLRHGVQSHCEWAAAVAPRPHPGQIRVRVRGSAQTEEPPTQGPPPRRPKQT